VVVVVNDAGLTLIRHVQDRQFGGRRCAVDLRNPSFAQLAQAYGIEATQVSDVHSAGEAVARALSRQRPALIELLQEGP
jgi:acetolactate synthase-1/2/3 large subunit